MRVRIWVSIGAGVLDAIFEVIIYALNNVIADEVAVVIPGEIDVAPLLTRNMHQDTSQVEIVLGGHVDGLSLVFSLQGTK